MRATCWRISTTASCSWSYIDVPLLTVSLVPPVSVRCLGHSLTRHHATSGPFRAATPCAALRAETAQVAVTIHGENRTVPRTDQLHPFKRCEIDTLRLVVDDFFPADNVNLGSTSMDAAPEGQHRRHCRLRGSVPPYACGRDASVNGCAGGVLVVYTIVCDGCSHTVYPR